MDWLSFVLTVAGLCLFETITSVDNAIINAEVLATMGERGFLGALTATFSSDENAARAIQRSAPILLAGGGTFLVFLFCHWLFQEEKRYGLPGESTSRSSRRRWAGPAPGHLRSGPGRGCGGGAPLPRAMPRPPPAGADPQPHDRPGK